MTQRPLARRCVIFSVKNLTDVSFFRTLCRSLKNDFMSARRCVIFYLTMSVIRQICECIFIKENLPKLVPFSFFY
jgi:hypothetical protein